VIEVVGDMWDYPLDIVQFCITTNGYVKTNKRAVMGKGCAKQARDRFPDIDLALGKKIKLNGNIFQPIYISPFILSFPVKHHWRDKADLDLIACSTLDLKKWAINRPQATIILPRPGCGNGQLDWEVVKPIVSVLPDNVHVITLPRGGP